MTGMVVFGIDERVIDATVFTHNPEQVLSMFECTVCKGLLKAVSDC